MTEPTTDRELAQEGTAAATGRADITAPDFDDPMMANGDTLRAALETIIEAWRAGYEAEAAMVRIARVVSDKGWTAEDGRRNVERETGRPLR